MAFITGHIGCDNSSGNSGGTTPAKEKRRTDPFIFTEALPLNTVVDLSLPYNDIEWIEVNIKGVQALRTQFTPQNGNQVVLNWEDPYPTPQRPLIIEISYTYD